MQIDIKMITNKLADISTELLAMRALLIKYIENEHKIDSDINKSKPVDARQAPTRS